MEYAENVRYMVNACDIVASDKFKPLVSFVLWKCTKIVEL